MKKKLIGIIAVLCLTIIACNDGFDIDAEIPDFDFPQTVTFEQNLSSYNIFQGTPSNLTPSDDYHLLELSSILFTDYAHKQRLVRVPAGTKMAKLNNGSIDFPDSTILVKTFFYYHDERDKSLGKNIIETRLLIKQNNIWNLATYLWNETQTEATLKLDGLDTQINWIDANGNSLSTLYHVPDENECITCHQSNSIVTPIGPKLRNLNRLVIRGGASLNQINHLQSVGILSDFQVDEIPNIVDYKDLNNSLAERGRAYLDLNCAHCHNPTAWEAASRENLDFRYETPLNQTGIVEENNRIVELVSQRQMPFIGTTILDTEGTNLVIEFIESL